MWILAQDADVLLNGNAFANYTLQDEITGKQYPIENNLLAISLTRLAKQNGETAELAQFLLGAPVEPKSKRVEHIIKAFENGVTRIKEDKEARVYMDMFDKAHMYGYAEGQETGKEIGKESALISTAANMLKIGMPIEQILKVIDLSTEKLMEIAKTVQTV